MAWRSEASLCLRRKKGEGKTFTCFLLFILFSQNKKRCSSLDSPSPNRWRACRFTNHERKLVRMRIKPDAPNMTPTRRDRTNRVAVYLYQTGRFVRCFYRAASLCGIRVTEGGRKLPRSNESLPARPSYWLAGGATSRWLARLNCWTLSALYRRMHSPNCSRLTRRLLPHHMLVHLSHFLYFLFYSSKSLFVL